MSRSLKKLYGFVTQSPSALTLAQRDKLIDLETIKTEFRVEELRAMSQLSVVLRSLTRRLLEGMEILPSTLDATGIYCLCPETGFDQSIVNQWNEKKITGPFQLARKLPPKQYMGSNASMCAAQISIESGARGAIYCTEPNLDSLNLMLTQFKMSQKPTVNAGLVTFGMTSPGLQIGYVSHHPTFDEQCCSEIKSDFVQLKKLSEECP